MKKPGRSFHPLLIAVFPVCFSYARELIEVDLAILRAPVVFALLCAMGVWWISWRLSRDWDRSALFTSLVCLLTFSTGHVHRFIAGRSWAEAVVVQNILILVLWLAGGIAIGILSFRWKSKLVPMAAGMNLFAALLLVVPAWRIVDQKVISPIRVRTLEVESRTGAGEGMRPDIYYIILDGFGRDDVLRSMYHHDNRWFLDSLQRLGFTVIPRARSNYGQTMESLASSLNFSYLESLIDSSHIKTSDRRPLRALLRQNGVFGFLKERGYTVTCVASGYSESEMPGVDTYRAPRWNLNEFDQFVISQTPIWSMLELIAPGWQYELNRERIDFAFRTLAASKPGNGPHFIFAHIVAPHPPFVFGRAGERVRDLEPLAIDDGSTYVTHVGRQEYVRRYREQISYVEGAVLRAMTSLLDQSPFEPVIILQGDHGPGSMLSWTNPSQTDLHERLSIFSAVYLPAGKRGNIPENLTPVNTFRLVFNRFFGTQLTLLPNWSGFSSWYQPYVYYSPPPETN